MIVVTATLVFILLLFAPIHFRVNVIVYLEQLSARVQVRSSLIKVFDNMFELRGRYLHCEGTVSTDVDMTTMDKQTGIDFLKCITIDKIALSLANNMLKLSMLAALIENVLAAIVTATLCNLSHCQFYTQICSTFGESHARVQVDLTTSVAELSFCLLKQGVKLWRTRILRKS